MEQSQPAKSRKIKGTSKKHKTKPNIPSQPADKKLAQKTDDVTEENELNIETIPDKPTQPAVYMPAIVEATRDTRTPSPFQKNKNAIAPMDDGEDATEMGASLVSVRTTTSAVKEAWVDENADAQRPPESNKTDAEKAAETTLSKAYVPYIYAKDCISRVVLDMENMKSRHLFIVHGIEANYKLIEQETQSQFNAFVLLLRQQYSQKVALCRQGIDAHKVELTEKESLWNQQLSSLSKRNKELLKEKNALLVQTKMELDAHETEKGERPLASSTPLTTEREPEVRDVSHVSRAPIVAAAGVGAARVGAIDREDMDRLRIDNERLLNELEEEKKQVIVLSNRLDQASGIKTDSGEIIPEIETTLMAAPVPQTGSNKDMEQTMVERETISVEQARIAADRDAISGERENFVIERERFNEERTRLQAEIVQTSKVNAEVQTKNDILTNQMISHVGLIASYKALQEQYNVVSKAAAAKSDSSTEFVEEELQTTKEEYNVLAKDTKALFKDIQKYEANFEKKNGRPPTEDDKDVTILDKYTQLEEALTMERSLKIKRETLETLGRGEVPQPVKHGSGALTVPQPVVTTVECLVPDKEAQIALEKTQKELDNLREQLSDCQSQNLELREDIVRLNSEATDRQITVEQLEYEIGQLRLGGGGVAAVSQMTREGTDMSEVMRAGAVTADSGQTEEIAVLENRVASLEADLTQEVAAHEHTREELETIEQQLSFATADMESQKLELEAKSEREMKDSQELLESTKEQLNEQEKRIEELENQQLANVPVDTAKEITQLRLKITTLQREKSEKASSTVSLTSQVTELQTRLELNAKTLATQRETVAQSALKLKASQTEKAELIKEWSGKVEKKDREISKEKQNAANLEKRVKRLEEAAITGTVVGGVAAGGKGGDKALKEQLLASRREVNELNEKLRRAEAELKLTQKGAATSGDAAAERMQTKKQEKILKELERKYEMEKRKCEKQDENLKLQEEELKSLKKDHGNTGKELAVLQAEMATLSVAAKEGIESAAKVKQLEGEVKQLTNENKILTENFNTERVLRKKYYNMVEDMKGKIRVYCRARPLSQTEKDRGNFSVLQSPDEYSIQIQSSRGQKEFQFDSIFMQDSSQEAVFEDTNNLIQSAVDGYNVCIFAYGQTGSGKTFTMIGDRDGKFPGIAPRAFQRMFEVIKENESKFKFEVTTYMLELYNEQLIDLYSVSGHLDHEKLDIRKDKKGMVYVQGSQIKSASNSKELYALFEEGSKNRHVASTQMNAESSRSHLVIAVIIESTNLSTGQVLRGKLSLVDLAGSERAAKTGSTAEQLKEAMSINKSLSALGDVISALSSEQSFIPYRNNKLTMLMQDSLGGNAKTLMFVNISPADYNQDESVISLTYASRVKLITNDATKNADNKEIARLKGIIAKLRGGEQVAPDELDDDEEET